MGVFSVFRVNWSGFAVWLTAHSKCTGDDGEGGKAVPLTAPLT